MAMSVLQHTMRKIGNSVITRLLIIGGLALILLIPVEMIKGIIGEREARRQGVITEVSSKWGREQTIVGPILSVPYNVQSTDDKGNTKTTIAHAHLLPEQLSVQGGVKPEIRYRGIYEVVLYNAELQVNAEFQLAGLAELGISDRDIQWDGATISMGLPDLRGVKENNLVSWNNETFPINSGIGAAPAMESGVSARVPVTSRQGTYSFRMKLNLNGSDQINFVPLGKVTTVQLSSPWKNPSFTGLFLPDDRVVNEQGFSAKWKILNLNRNYPQQWTGKNDKILESAFGAKFFCPVDEYQKTMRSAKYAVLFILLTLGAFFLTEVTTGTRVHPVQYLLIGFAIALFYLLLLSLSEHTSFAMAYLISAGAATLLVTAYSRGILKNSAIALGIGALMTCLYGFLYVTMQLEDYALLLGSVGMFVTLCGVMFLTRKIDWYAISSSKPLGNEPAEEWEFRS
jgi:inner membrane protein